MLNSSDVQKDQAHMWVEYHHERVLKTRLGRLKRELGSCNDIETVKRIERELDAIEQEVHAYVTPVVQKVQ